MIVKDEILPSKVELSGAQRAQLEERLQRARLAAGRTTENRTIPRRTSPENLPLSFAQEGLWFLDQLEPGSAVYNVFQALRLKGTLDVPVLEKALNEIIRRHEILRTNFVVADGAGVQVIAPSRSLAIVLTDLGDREPGAMAEELRACLQEESRRPFDFARDLLMRVRLIRVAPAEHVLMLTMHHIISDGWSLGLLFRELAALYTAFRRGEPAPLPELPIQFADFALWERENLRGPALDKSLNYWRKQLGGTLPVLELPTDRARSLTSTARGGMQSVQLPLPLSQSLKQLAQQEGATLYMALLAAFKVLLHRWTGQEDIVVGSVVAGRRKIELEKLIGFFVNTIVLRTDVSGNPTFRQLVGRVRACAVAAMAHQDLPFERLVKELRPDRSLSRNPLFQVLFVLQNAPMAPADLPDLSLEVIDVDNATTKFDLTLSMIEGPQGLRAALEYNADLFEPETISRLFGCFQTLLESIVAQPDRPIGELALLTPAERHQMVTEWNQTRVPYPRDHTVHALFEEQARRFPDAVALVGDEGTLTYTELNARANQLAHRLRRHGVKPGTLVALCLERSVEMVVALLGILKAGGAYVSLDPAYPHERLALMLADSEAPVVLTMAALESTLPKAGTAAPGPHVIRLDADAAEIAGEANENPPPAAVAESLAYVSYTSGSTGKPKGVCIPHRAINRLVFNAGYLQLGPDDAVAQIANCAFDASTFEIWGPLLNGGRLVIIPPAVVLDPAKLKAALARHGVTAMFLTTALFNQLVQTESELFRPIRHVLFGGEACNPGAVREFLGWRFGTRLLHVYGPTETTTFATWHEVREVPDGAISVPIGRPIGNTTTYVLDPHRQPVPVGVPGELYLGGDGVARGYLRRPELDAARFVTDPFADEPGARLYRTGDRVRWRPDGAIEFLGRLDRQVKIRGFRIEPEEVEVVLQRHPAVIQAAVEVRPGPAGDSQLVAFVAPKLSLNDVKGHLQSVLPDYMIPATFVLLDELPLNANGKVDRAALPRVEATTRQAHCAPRDETERKLAAIWQSVLGLKSIGVHDGFFELGGHSLLAVRMVAQVERQFGRKLEIAAIFQHGSIAQLARLLRPEGINAGDETSLVEIQGQGSESPLFLVHGVGGGMFWGYANLARCLDGTRPVYGFKSRGLDGLPEWPTIEEMAAHYIADLRAHQPHGPYLLGGYCFGGVVAYEMARQLHQQKEEVAFLALINCSPPNSKYEKGRRRSLDWQLKFVRNLCYWAGCFLFRWSMRERRDFVRWKIRALRRRNAATDLEGQNATEMTLTDIDELLNLANYSDRQRELWQRHVRALFDYHPQPYAGRVTLFRTGGHPLFSSFDEQFGWGELACGGVEVRLMPGGHGNILDEPHVRAVAQSFQTCLRALAPTRESNA